MEISAAKCQDKSEATSASCSIIFIMATSNVLVDPSFAPDYMAGMSQWLTTAHLKLLGCFYFHE